MKLKIARHAETNSSVFADVIANAFAELRLMLETNGSTSVSKTSFYNGITLFSFVGRNRRLRHFIHPKPT